MKKINFFIMILIVSVLLVACFEKKTVDDYTIEELIYLPEDELKELTKNLSKSEKEELTKKIFEELLNNSFNSEEDIIENNK